MADETHEAPTLRIESREGVNDWDKPERDEFFRRLGVKLHELMGGEEPGTIAAAVELVAEEICQGSPVSPDELTDKLLDSPIPNNINDYDTGWLVNVSWESGWMMGSAASGLSAFDFGSGRIFAFQQGDPVGDDWMYDYEEDPWIGDWAPLRQAPDDADWIHNVVEDFIWACGLPTEGTSVRTYDGFSRSDLRDIYTRMISNQTALAATGEWLGVDPPGDSKEAKANMIELLVDKILG